MIARNWTMAAALPALMFAVSGISSPAVADGAKNCRQYVPGAGITIAVDCGQPVAALVLASAPLKCRRYIPGAGLAIEEACPEDVAPIKLQAVSATQEPVAGPRKPKTALPPEAAVSGGALAKPAKPERIEKSAAVIDASKAETITCSGALDRAQLGAETDRDLKALRSGCTSGG